MMSGAWMVDGGVLRDFALMTGVRGVLLLSAVAGVALLLRRASAARRHLVWSLGMVGLLLLPVAQLAVPRWSVEVPGARWLGTDRPGEDAWVRTAATGGEGAGVGAGAAVERGFTMERARTEAAPSSRVDGARGPDWSLLLLGVWGLGVLVLGGTVLASHGALRTLQASARPVPGDRVARELSHLAVVMGVGRPVRLLEGGEGQMPMSWGLLRPVILLPRGAERWPASRLRAVLLHELAHVRRRDCLTQILAEVVRAVHWPNPLAWIGAWRLRVEREHACDDRVLQAGARASAYADELLSLARGFRTHPRASRAAVAMARLSNLESRLTAVLAEGRRRTLSRRGAAVTAVTALLLTTAAAGVSAVPGPGSPVGAAPNQAPRGSLALGPDVAGQGAAEADETARAGGRWVPPTRSAQAVSCGSERAEWHSSSHRRNDDRTRVTWSRPGCEVDVLLSSEVEFDATFHDVARLGPGARLRIEENDGGTERRLEITPDAGGAPVYAYRVGDEERSFDADARAWYEALLLQLFRRAGFMAEERVAAFLAEGGVPAVLQELELLETDHVYARYVEETIRQAELSQDRLEQLLGQAASRVDSDHYLAGILEAVAGDTALNDRMLDTFIEASRTLESDHYRTEVLETALGRGDLSDAQVRSLLESASEIDSDHYQAEILEGVAARYALRAELREVYLEAVDRIESDHYMAEVLSGLLERSDLELADEQLQRIIEASIGIGSDHYRSEILVEVAERHRLRDAARDAYVRAMETIDSRHYRGRVAEALVRQGG